MIKLTFAELLKDQEVQLKIEEIKNKMGYSYGRNIEKHILTLLSRMNSFKVKEEDVETDIAFGADAHVSYIEDGINNSFYIDVTTNDEKKNTDFMNLKGDIVPLEEAHVINIGGAEIRLGIKRWHGRHYRYKKPVIVMHFREIKMNYYLWEIDPEQEMLLDVLLKALNYTISKESKSKRASKVIFKEVK